MSLRHQRGYVFEASCAFYVRYYVMVEGTRKQKAHWPHWLCAKDRSTGHGNKSAKAVQHRCEDFMRGEVHTDVSHHQDLTISKFWETTYLLFITENNLKPSTLQGYQQIWNQHLKTHFGNGSLKGSRTSQMSNFLTPLRKTLRPRTLNHIKWFASAIFAHAVATSARQTPSGMLRYSTKRWGMGKQRLTRWKRLRMSSPRWLTGLIVN